jgi:hypothetical protein
MGRFSLLEHVVDIAKGGFIGIPSTDLPTGLFGNES